MQDPKPQTTASAERKPVTIFFADIVASTEKAEALDPEEWREVVVGAHARVGEAVGRYEGTVAQLLGDGVLAFFGAPVTHEDDPERAVRAALDLQELIEDYADDLAGYVDDFAMRVGIHAGTVVVGEIGSEERSEYLAVGDAVNVAARLEGAAEPGQIVVSEQIARRVRPTFELCDLGEVELKGKSEPMPIIAIVGEKAVPDRTRGLADTERVFVGREHELQQLQGAVLDLCRGYGQIRFILGEAGIGKSRLVEELRNNLPEPPAGEGLLAQPEEVRWIEARALSYGSSLSYWLISQLLLSDLGLSDGAPAPRLRAALRKRSGDLFGDRAEEFEPFLSRLLGLPLKVGQEERLQEYDSETLRHETFRAINTYFAELAEQSPVVLVLEDLHWADPSSLEALEQLLGVTDQAPLMVLALMRIEDQHGSWGLKVTAERTYRHRFDDLYLNALQTEEADELLTRVLGEGSRGSPVAEMVLARAEGNPFYLEELLRHLLERNLIVRENGHWVTTAKLERVGVPDTLQGVLLARIGQLEEDVQRTLQVASVIGRSFLYRLLAVISEAEQELQAHLSRLQRADLVREKARLPELEYIFKHALTQEAAYNALLVEQRQRYHQRVAEAVEAQFSDRLEEYHGLLAHHYSAAGDADKAIDYLTRAADQARLDDSLTEAKQLLHQLLDLLDGQGRTDLEARTWMKLALIHQTDFEFDLAHQAYEKAFELSDALEAPVYDRDAPSAGTAEASLHIPLLHNVVRAIDLTKPSFVVSINLLRSVQAGLAEVDDELNVVPNSARSWEVREGGKKYIFHLRDDVRWNDGTRVIAHDFKDYWIWRMRNVELKGDSWLDALEGGRQFRLGEHDDPNQVGIEVPSDHELELTLVEPTAHFLFLISLYGFPAPRDLLRSHGEHWWQPPHGLFSGPFTIDEYNDEKLVLRRNQYYFGDISGNLAQVSFRGYESFTDWAEAYGNDQIDILWEDGLNQMDGPVPEGELVKSSVTLAIRFAILNPAVPPTNRPEFREALARSISRLQDFSGIVDGYRPAWGGLVPPGMPGHSNDLALATDVERAKQLVGDMGNRTLRVAVPPGFHWDNRIKSHLQPWIDELGFKIDFISFSWGRELDVKNLSVHLMMSGWIADYPDPHTFLVQMIKKMSSNMGWSDPNFNALVDELQTARDRKERMRLFRKIDRFLVRESVLTIPLMYAGTETHLIKPWVHGFEENPLGYSHLKDVTVHRREG